MIALESLNFWLNIIATMIFAITAVLAIGDRDVDIFGVIVLGSMTAVGGGTVRDLVLGVPVFWLHRPEYIGVSVLASILAFVARSFFTLPQVYRSLLYLDALGAALFGIQGTLKTWDLGIALPVAPVIFGVVTAIGGGLIRDMLAGRQTLLMTPELYAIPVLIGCSLLVGVLGFFPAHTVDAAMVCAAIIFIIRAAAIHWHLRVPDFLIIKSRTDFNKDGK